MKSLTDNFATERQAIIDGSMEKKVVTEKGTGSLLFFFQTLR